jgi:hypothetical protein
MYTQHMSCTVHTTYATYEEEDTCMSYEEEDTCMSYELHSAHNTLDNRV